MSRHSHLPALLLACFLAVSCGDRPANGPDPAAEGAVQAEATAEEPNADETFARGLGYHISDVVLGDDGTIAFQKDMPISFRFQRQDDAPADVELVVEAEMGAGSVVNTSAAVTMPDERRGEASATVPEPLSMILGVPGAEATARAWLVSPASGAEASNVVIVPYRVVEAP